MTVPVLSLLGASARRALLIAGAAIVALLLVVAGVQTWRLHRAQAAVHDAGLAVVNAQAVADSTRALRGRDSVALARVYGDSVAAVQRLAVQAVLQRDALSKQLGTVAHAVASLTATVDVLRLAGQPSAGPTVEDSAGTRRAAFDVRQVPYTVHADVALPRTGPGTLDTLRVALDPARLVPRLECGNPNAFGIRPAQIVVVTPPWLRTTVDSATLDPGVCNPDPPPRLRRWSLGVGAGYGLTYNRRTRQLFEGPQIGVHASVRIW